MNESTKPTKKRKVTPAADDQVTLTQIARGEKITTNPAASSNTESVQTKSEKTEVTNG